MSLSERLAEAAARRGQPEQPANVARRSTQHVDVLDGTQPDSGLPAPCPDCNGPGYLEKIDLSSRRQHERCRVCGNRWSRAV